jgi:hypothetical protein
VPSAPSNEGLRSDALRAALGAALDGKWRQLEMLLCRYGGGPDRKPNLRLAAAFGAEIAALPAFSPGVGRLLAHFAANDAAPDTPEVFLPIAAAHGWVAELRARREAPTAWAALAALAGDERAPVRLGTLDALTSFAARRVSSGEPSGAKTLIAVARGWLDSEDREQRFGAAAVVTEVFADRQVLAALDEPEALLDYLSRALDAVATAPRAAERSDARRRLLLSLPRTLGAVVVGFGRGDRGAGWLEAECAAARHPDVRGALSNAILGLGAKALGQGAEVAQRLRTALEGSAKPPRDPTRRRPGTARGKSSRRMR